MLGSVRQKHAAAVPRLTLQPGDQSSPARHAAAALALRKHRSQAVRRPLQRAGLFPSVRAST